LASEEDDDNSEDSDDVDISSFEHVNSESGGKEDRSYNNKEEQDSEEESEDSEDYVESEYGVSLPDLSKLCWEPRSEDEF